MEYIVNIQETPEGARRLTVDAKNEAEAIQKAEAGFPDAVVISAKPKVAMHTLAPHTDALVLKIADYPEAAAKKVRGEVKQLQVGIKALYEGVREVGMLAAKYEIALFEIARVADAQNMQKNDGFDAIRDRAWQALGIEG